MSTNQENAPDLISLRAASCPATDKTSLAIAIIIFAVLSLAASITSNGFLEADGCTHYLYARFALDQPHYLVNVWGRPLCTALYAIPATLGGRFGVRTASLLLAIGCALVARSIAKALGDRRPTLAAIFTLAQPLVFLHSFSELTELPFALLLGVAFLSYIRGWYFLMALLVALSPLSRPEGFGFLILAAVALVLHRRLRWLLLLPIPLIILDIAGWALYGKPTYPGLAERLPHMLQWITWLPNNWPYADKSAYEPGSIFHFVMLMPAIASPLIFPALCLGLWRTFSRSGPADHVARCRYLSAILPLLIVVGHSLLYWTGRMASSGELRYISVVAPFWGVLSARGWVWLFERYRWQRMMWAAALASLVPITANHFYQVIPLAYSEDWLEAQQLARWLEEMPHRREYPQILAAHPGIFYFLEISYTDHSRAREWKKQSVDHPRPGTVLIWDSIYGVYNADTSRSVPLQEIIDAGWREYPTPLRRDKLNPQTHQWEPDWRIFLSPQGLSTIGSSRPSPQ